MTVADAESEVPQYRNISDCDLSVRIMYGCYDGGEDDSLHLPSIHRQKERSFAVTERAYLGNKLELVE